MTPLAEFDELNKTSRRICRRRRRRAAGRQIHGG